MRGNEQTEQSITIQTEFRLLLFVSSSDCTHISQRQRHYISSFKILLRNDFIISSMYCMLWMDDSVANRGSCALYRWCMYEDVHGREISQREISIDQEIKRERNRSQQTLQM
eukprot:TRINITY_DN11003_c0_g1_i5.p1 TRINITY_DN11003_c0_g1~~TRINITY_DN11003_c0_g1_i5.p1  ORF type:complete len:112 (+),score=9.62 TRINITY_DN11003_c0_g1_i5:150-485(+)